MSSSSLSFPPSSLSACADCGTTDPTLLYRSGKMKRCYDCQNFANLQAKTTGGGVHFSREAFVAWKRGGADARHCAYCGIDGATLYALNAINVRTGKRFESIGVDRLDNTRPYTLDNLAPCCPLCNGVKSNILSAAEMRVLGPQLRQLWEARLALQAASTGGAASVTAPVASGSPRAAA